MTSTESKGTFWTLTSTSSKEAVQLYFEPIFRISAWCLGQKRLKRARRQVRVRLSQLRLAMEPDKVWAPQMRLNDALEWTIEGLRVLLQAQKQELTPEQALQQVWTQDKVIAQHELTRRLRRASLLAEELTPEQVLEMVQDEVRKRVQELLYWRKEELAEVSECKVRLEREHVLMEGEALEQELDQVLEQVRELVQELPLSQALKLKQVLEDVRGLIGKLMLVRDRVREQVLERVRVLAQELPLGQALKLEQVLEHAWAQERFLKEDLNTEQVMLRTENRLETLLEACRKVHNVLSLREVMPEHVLELEQVLLLELEKGIREQDSSVVKLQNRQEKSLIL